MVNLMLLYNYHSINLLFRVQNTYKKIVDIIIFFSTTKIIVLFEFILCLYFPLIYKSSSFEFSIHTYSND